MQIQRSGRSDAIKKMLKELESKEIKVGFFETAKYPDGTPIAYVASIQEFGHGPIPPRPFMRPAELQNKNKWQKGIASGVKAALNGQMTIDHALTQVALVAAGDVKKAIKAVTAPPLSLLTLILRKHKKNPDAAPIGGKLVGQKAGEINFMGPRPKKDKTLSISGVSTKPLIDTGQMFQAVTGAVVNK